MQIPIRYGKDDIIDLSVPEKIYWEFLTPTPWLNLTKRRSSQRLWQIR